MKIKNEIQKIEEDTNTIKNIAKWIRDGFLDTAEEEGLEEELEDELEHCSEDFAIERPVYI